MRWVLVLSIVLAGCGAPRTASPPLAQGGTGGELEPVISQPANCAEGSDRICRLIVPDPNNPDALTVAVAHRDEGEQYLYAVLPDRGSVVQVDLQTARVNWEVSSGGDGPGAMAEPWDGSIWVANSGGLVHLDSGGNLICRAAVPDLAPSLAMYSGNVWASDRSGVLRRYTGNETSGKDIDGVPLCAAYELPGGPLALPLPVESLGIDDLGILWTANGSETSLRVDTSTGTWDEIRHRGHAGRVVVDARTGDAYFDGFALHRISGQGPYVDPGTYELDGPSNPDAFALTWDERLLASYGSLLDEIDLDTLARMPLRILPGGHSAVGVAAGYQDDVWVALQHGNLTRVDRNDDATPIVTSSVNAVDSSSMEVHASWGTWIQVVESDTPRDWLAMTWTELRPKGTVVRAGARFGATRQEVVGLKPACSTTAGSPLDLTTCPGSTGSRFAAFSFYLQAGSDGSKPTVGDIRLMRQP